MAHGTPDWGVTAGRVTTYQLTDLGELAARLESVVTYDRRGDVAFLDGFESGLSAYVLVLSSGGGLDLSLAAQRTGRASARLFHDGAAGASASLQRGIPVLKPTRLGFEAHIWPDATILSLELTLGLSDGATERRFSADWRSDTLQLRAGSEVLATSLDLRNIVGLFSAFKLVGDFDTETWVRLLLNDTEYAPSGAPSSVAASPAIPYVRFTVAAEGDGGAVAGEANLDSVIVTQNEP